MRRRSTDIIVVFVILLLGSVLLAQDLPAGASNLLAGTQLLAPRPNIADQRVSDVHLSANLQLLLPRTTLIVTSTTDSGPGSLRQALLSAIPGDTITFDPAIFPPTSPMTITLLSALPEINQGNLTIDASNAGVVLDGRYATGADGLRITSDGNVIKGLQIIRFPGDGVEITNGAKNNTIGGDWTVGSAPHGEGNVITLNDDDGVDINGTDTMSNTVSGNLIGLDLDGTRDIRVQAMAISPDYANDQTLFIGTKFHGVWKTTDGGSSWAEVNSGLTISNVQALAISPNYASDRTLFAGTADGGLFKTTSGGSSWTRVDGGMTSSDVVALAISPDYASDGHIFAATEGNGVFASTDGGDTWAARNSGLADTWLRALVVSPNYGVDRTLFAAAWNTIFRSVNQGYNWTVASSGVVTNAHALAISPNYASDQTLFAGTNQCDTDLMFKSTDGGSNWASVGGEPGWCRIRALAISPNYATDQTLFVGDVWNGIFKSSDGGTRWLKVLQSSQVNEALAVSPAYAQDQTIFVGTSADGVFKSVGGGSTWAEANAGLTERGNRVTGVFIWGGAQGNTIGGDSPGKRNVISNNGDPGVEIRDTGTANNTVSGNYIGTDASGVATLGNGTAGVSIDHGAQYNTIGGNQEEKRNVISGNGACGWCAGVGLKYSDTMSNTISGNYIGTDASGTAPLGNQWGVACWEEAQRNTIEGNVISGNEEHGIHFYSCDGNTIVSNHIGTDASGTATLGNGGAGVVIRGGAQYNRVGGTTTAERNVISGNGADGMGLWDSGTMSNTIVGNYIGIDASGTADLGNGLAGIDLSNGSQQNLIGDGNVIAYNNGNGIGVWDSATLSNTITQNSIHNNTFQGIAIGDGGNAELSPPALTSVTASTVSGIAPMAYVTIEIFSDDEDEGRVYEGTTTADAGGFFSFSKATPFTGPYLTATATDSDGNTSEFSSPVAVPGPTRTPTPAPTVPTPTPTAPTPTPPDIRVTPAAVEVTLPEGDSTTVPLTIANAGGAALTFSIAKEQGSTGAGVQGGEGEREKGKKGKRGQRSRGAGEHGSEGDVKPVLRPVEVVDPALLDALDAAPDGQVAFFVYLKEQADLSPAYAIQDWKARGEFVYHTLRETAQRSQKELLADLRQQQLAGTVTDYQPFFILNAVAVIGGRSAVDALAARPDVAYLAPEPVFHIPEPLDEKPTSAAPNGVEWNVAQVRADQVWADGITGAGVVVANIDTGVDASHPALVSQYRGTATGSHDYNWFDPTGHYPTVPGDNHGHGTHVMGTMVGDDGAGNQIGVAPGAQWIAAKGCAGRGCAGSDLLAAAEWVLAPCPIGVAPGDPACDAAKRPQVVNNSWGGAGGDPWFESMVSAWRAAGIFPAFAAGNSGPGDGTVGSPGDYATSFASGATDQADTICWFSSRGPSRLTPETKPDLAAPGCRGIRSALPGGSYGTKNGTSMASPHTAGVVALLLQANPGLTVEEIEALLTSTALDLGPQGPDKTYGHGRLDAYAAVSQAGDPVPWLVVDPTSGTVNPGNQTEVTLTLDAAGLSTGTHTADLVITSNDPDEPTVTVPVTLTVTSGSPTISHVRVSNLRDVSASVSWITTVDADGRVYYGTDPASLTNVAHDDRGAGIEDDVHHVTIGGLTPNTTYYFYVVSDGASDDNEGQYYQFTTGAPLSVPGSDSVWGQVFKGDGVTPAADVLVYLQVLNNDASGSPGQSGLLSGLTDSNGFWIDSKTGGAVNLAAVRTEDGGSYFVYSESGDALRIEVQGAAECEGLMQVDTADDRPAPDISLSCLNMINLDITTGWSVFVWPAVPSEAYDASDLLGAILDAGGDVPEISQWMSELGNWSGHLRGLPFGDFEVAPGEPYFLRSTRRSLLRLEAGVGIAQSEAITLTTGWNFAALPRTAGVMTAEAACEQIATQGGAVEEIDRWDANVGNWAGHICGLPFGDFEVTPEEGYFVKSGADSVWRPSGGAGVQGSTGAGEKGRKGKREQGNTATRDPLFPYSLIPLFPYSLIPLSTFPIVGEVEIRNVRVTNVTDRSFSVVWETDRAVPGWVRFATIRNPKPVLSPVEVSEIRNWMVAYDDRGAEVAASTHHVTVAGLSPGTSYSFAVVSGTTKEDNGGQLYRVSTGPTLGIPAVQTAYGRVLGTDGETSVVGALVLLLLRDGDGAGSPGESAPLSAVTDEQGYWSVNLGAARTVAGDAHFTSDGADRVAVRAWHPALGWAVEEVTLNELPAALPLELRVAWQTHLPFVVRR